MLQIANQSTCIAVSHKCSNMYTILNYGKVRSKKLLLNTFSLEFRKAIGHNEHYGHMPNITTSGGVL